MQSFRILSATVASLLCAVSLHAQAPAPTTPPVAPAPPATPATPATPTTPTTPATPPVDPAKKVKLSPAESRALTQLAEAVLLQRTLGEAGKGKAKVSADAGKFGESVAAELMAEWTPLVTLAQTRGAEVPTSISKNDKADIEKLGKVKDEKYGVEFFELFTKHAKRNARTIETAVKAFTDPELKAKGAAIAKLINAEADKSEATYKELKSPKKDAKK
jgi:hypothetical protein